MGSCFWRSLAKCILELKTPGNALTLHRLRIGYPSQQRLLAEQAQDGGRSGPWLSPHRKLSLPCAAVGTDFVSHKQMLGPNMGNLGDKLRFVNQSPTSLTRSPW